LSTAQKHNRQFSKHNWLKPNNDEDERPKCVGTANDGSNEVESNSPEKEKDFVTLKEIKWSVSLSMGQWLNSELLFLFFYVTNGNAQKLNIND